MQILDQAVAAMRTRGAPGAAVAAKLEAIAVLGEEAARVWQEYLAKPGAPGDKYTLVSWIGADRARQLYELHLRVAALVEEVCAAAGPQARFLVLDESPVVMAYAQLREGETGPQAAQQRFAAQQAMNKHIRDLANQVRNLKPGTAKAGAKPAGQKPAVPARAKKAAPRKKPAAKKAAPKKAAKKVAKKAAKKAAPKKK
jgi:hypothetical protein